MPVGASQTELEEMARSNSERQDWIVEERHQDRRVLDSDFWMVSDFKASATDLDLPLMPLKRGVFLGYHVHYAVNGGKSRIILKALVTPWEVMENAPMLDLLWRHRFWWKLRSHPVTSDTNYGTVDNTVAVEDEGIRACLPETDTNSPRFKRRDFQWDEQGEG